VVSSLFGVTFRQVDGRGKEFLEGDTTLEANATNGKNTRLITLIAVVLLLTIIVLATAYYGRVGRVTEPSSARINLTTHPTYSMYDYGQNDSILDLGVQPLWIPTNLIIEVMKRDALLEAALAEHGTVIRYHNFLKGDDANFFLERGDLEGVVSGDAPTLTAAVRVGTTIVSLMHLGFTSIVANRLMLLKDLRGKRVGCAFGTAAEYAFLIAISYVGLSPDDVEIVYMDNVEMPGALEQGDIEAFAGWEPTVSTALKRVDNSAVIHRSTTSGYLYFAGSYAERHPAVIRHIVAAQTRAMIWIKSDVTNLATASDWAVSVVSNATGKKSILTASDYARLAEAGLLNTNTTPIVPKELLAEGSRFHRKLQLLVELGLIPEATDWSTVVECFDRKILLEVISRKHEYQLNKYRNPMVPKSGAHHEPE
jgi:sulfonate transport system substrate-binding protein